MFERRVAGRLFLETGRRRRDACRLPQTIRAQEHAVSSNAVMAGSATLCVDDWLLETSPHRRTDAGIRPTSRLVSVTRGAQKRFAPPAPVSPNGVPGPENPGDKANVATAHQARRSEIHMKGGLFRRMVRKWGEVRRAKRFCSSA